MKPEPASVHPADPSLREARADVVGRLCDGFSHDARNPLNAVVIHLEVLADKLRREHQGQVPYGLERNLKAIRDQVTRIDEMVRRFVELAAPHRQHEPDVELTPLLQSVVEQCTHHARLLRADVRMDGPSGVRVSASASDLGVAIAGLLLNQLDAGAKRLALHVESAAQRATISFEGTLPLAPEQLESAVRAIEHLGGSVNVTQGSIQLQLPATREPSLRVVDDSRTP